MWASVGMCSCVDVCGCGCGWVRVFVGVYGCVRMGVFAGVCTSSGAMSQNNSGLVLKRWVLT